MNSKLFQKFSTAIFILAFCVSTTVCQTQTKTTKETTQPNGNLPKVENFDKPQTFQYKPENLPAPFATESARRNSKIVEQPANATLKLPKGFQINVFAEGDFKYPRWMALAPNGDVFVADSRANSIIILRDTNKDGTADERFTFAENFRSRSEWLFVKIGFMLPIPIRSCVSNIKPDRPKPTAQPEKIIELTDGGYNQHWTRNILFSPDGKKLYVSIGSETNADVENDPRRAARRFMTRTGKITAFMPRV